MRPADQPARVFSTAGLPEARRVELWESHNASALIGLAVHADRPLEATEVNVQLPRVQLARVAGSPHAVARTTEAIRRDPADAIAVYLLLRGDSWFRTGSGTHAVRAGTAVICEADRPFARGFALGLEELVVKVPHAALPGAPAVPEPRQASLAGDPYTRALARVAGRATADGQRVPADEATVLDLVSVLIAGRRASPASAHRAAARSYIEDHLTEPDLGAGRIAAAIGISERQLSRVFAADDTSVPRHILSRRLQLAHALLAGAPGDVPVAEVAARCGFTSAAYFSHAFAGHFGRRASEVRASAGL
ncbi:MAG TPA: helix-turn-helix domain-containing protein [Trebonia sp.]|nr:helix-turn-helix domain-containing protein [Trebonia sp.]